MIEGVGIRGEGGVEWRRVEKGGEEGRGLVPRRLEGGEERGLEGGKGGEQGMRRQWNGEVGVVEVFGEVFGEEKEGREVRVPVAGKKRKGRA